MGYAFEKQDAREKYGNENVFSPMMGGRSLRFTGEMTYGSSVTGLYEPSAEEQAFFGVVNSSEMFDHNDDDDDSEDDEALEQHSPKDFAAKRVELCVDVGGLDIWHAFFEKLTANPGPNLSRETW